MANLQYNTVVTTSIGGTNTVLYTIRHHSHTPSLTTTVYTDTVIHTSNTHNPYATTNVPAHSSHKTMNQQHISHQQHPLYTLFYQET